MTQRPSLKYLKSVTVIVSGESEETGERWIGTGVVVKITSDFTYILTNKHVVGVGLGVSGVNIKVIDSLSRTCRDAEIVKTHPVVDLAIIKITGKILGKQAIKGVAFPKVTEKIYTVGHSLGRLYLYAEGVFSGNMGLYDIYQIPTMWGSSGSGLFNAQGDLVGMIFALDYDIIGLFFPVIDIAHCRAIPAIYIQNFLKNVLGSR